MQAPLQETLRKLKSIFPEAVTETQRTDEEGKPYFAYAIKEEFVEYLWDSDLFIADDQNRYELQFPNKQAARALASVPSYKTLVADREQSKDFDSTGNLFIEGNNIDALRMLQRSYQGKVKMIYIDPPYNTGSDGFMYNDDFSIRQRKYLKVIGALDDDGERHISQTKDGLRGRFHAGWLAMMYPRLKLARELLSEDGVIFISIDDNEAANLKLICDELFGEKNFVNNLIWEKKIRPSNKNKNGFSKTTENILFYKKSPEDFAILGVKKNKEYIERAYRNPDNDPRGLWRTKPLYSESNYNKRKFLTLPDGTKREEKWFIGQEKLNLLYEEERIYISQTGTINEKLFYTQENQNAIQLLKAEEVGTTESATKFLKSIFSNKNIFPNPKPVNLIKFLVKQTTREEDIILDFFSGSATTAHAVMQLNAEDGGNRKFIMVQWPEKIDPKKAKEAHAFCTKKLKRPATIAEIAKERIRRAGAKVRAAHPDKQIDDGFRVYVVQDSLLMDNDNRRFDQTEQWELADFITDLSKEKFEPLLYEAMLHTGVMLDMSMVKREIEGYPFAICNRRCYCVTENLNQSIVRKITEQHGDEFDIFYYLSDCPAPKVSYTELESAIKLDPRGKKIEHLNFY